MININSLERVNALIADAETLNVEFKETTGQLERGMETLCAFLNGSGGTVLFGIANNGKIVGQEVSDTTKKKHR
jgi:ATP-dependent DNA helicase RecG